ncbi:unnamed protein product [Meloidogyne enterolobii]|uniref:Uncharacterized protein n=1 Tax=Meloidogyne enterolobii TaxID=390850 RepID=A0ACB0ZHU8_MELEN
MITTLKKCNQDFGIYTSKEDWFEITGDTKIFENVELLYDKELYNQNNFYDFIKFGSFVKPSAKLYDYTINCGIHVANAYKPFLNGCYESEVQK